MLNVQYDDIQGKTIPVSKISLYHIQALNKNVLKKQGHCINSTRTVAANGPARRNQPRRCSRKSRFSPRQEQMYRPMPKGSIHGPENVLPTRRQTAAIKNVIHCMTSFQVDSPEDLYRMALQAPSQFRNSMQEHSPW